MANAPKPSLEITGLVRGGRAAFDRAALARLEAGAQIADVGTLVAKKQGRAVRLAALARAVGCDTQSARFLHILSSDAGFAVSVPLDEVLESAVIVYELGRDALPDAKGGPFRLLAVGHPDECVSVKALARLTFAAEPGPDTRPTNDEEHRRLHERARAKSQS
ncbi:MAG: molybdopterin-dependent oxidoreductase [Planctomycetes bacterium]|nr:molybdopterin-dependent oxidoreductase [Planctomycetota bacterium]